MPSEFQTLLKNLQSDLNVITVSAAAANHSLSGMIEGYTDPYGEHSKETRMNCVSNWSKSIDVLTEALESFSNNGAKLMEYLNGQR